MHPHGIWPQMHRYAWVGFIVLLCVVMMTGCTSAPARIVPTAHPEPTTPARVTPASDAYGRVTMSIFSGQPNPTWPLSSEDYAFIQTMLPTLPTTTTQVLQDGLSYQGFGVELRDPSTQRITSLTVFDGVITVTTPTGRTVLQDEERALERWLMERHSPYGRVTMSIFSDQPNPTWALSSEEYTFIQTTLPTLPTTTPQGMLPTPTPQAVQDGQENYQGLLVELRDPSTQITTSLTIVNGIMTVTTPTSRTVLQDPGRALEQWLLERSRPGGITARRPLPSLP